MDKIIHVKVVRLPKELMGWWFERQVGHTFEVVDLGHKLGGVPAYEILSCQFNDSLLEGQGTFSYSGLPTGFLLMKEVTEVVELDNQAYELNLRSSNEFEIEGRESVESSDYRHKRAKG